MLSKILQKTQATKEAKKPVTLLRAVQPSAAFASLRLCAFALK
jgi:hypothetical protein